MAIFSKESLETLRQRVDLVDLLSSHMELKRTGAAYKGLCPFHDEKSPSFVIQKGDSHYHCFGCGAHGDAVQFLMSQLKMSFSDAVESLAQRYHVHLDRLEGGEEYKGPPKALMKEALAHASRFYHFILLHTPEGHAALKYLFKRGIDLTFIRNFMIGLAPATPGIFRKTMHAKGIADEILAAAGLLAPGRQDTWRDFFSERITFPICDPTGAVIGFSARKYREETFGGKYVNTAETPLFKKSRVLFGLNYSRRRIAKEGLALIVEGQVDALRLIQEGFNITVAGQGTAFGESHAKELINLGVKLVYLALDSDNAGLEAASKIGNLFQKQGIEVLVVRLPQGEDPDSFIRKSGAEAFVKLMEEGEDYLTFLVSHLSRSVDMHSPAGKNELIRLVSQQIREWEHPVMVQESLRKLAHLTKVPEQMVGAMQDHLPNIYIKRSASIGLQTIDADRILEADFLRWILLLGEPSFLEIARMNVDPSHLRSSVCRKIYEAYLRNIDEKQSCDLLTLITEVEDPDAQGLITDVMHRKVNKDRADELYQATIQRILDRNWMQQREEIRMKIQSGECSDDEALALLKRFDELKACQPTLRKPPPAVQRP